MEGNKGGLETLETLVKVWYIPQIDHRRWKIAPTVSALMHIRRFCSDLLAMIARPTVLAWTHSKLKIVLGVYLLEYVFYK